jgi:ubiquinone/menaquinone biosynthesis C-methylase UbiE
MTPGGFSSDCWGRLNDVADITPVLTILDDLPEGFRHARQTMIAHLGLRPSSHVLEAGSGPGTALPDLMKWVSEQGRIVGIDPTSALVEQARERARAAGIAYVTYDVGDIRQIHHPDATFDAAFCDKILVHVSPIAQAISELARVTRAGGRVGAVEWYSQGMVVAAADYALTRRVFDGSAPVAAENPMAPLELEASFAAAGLTSVQSGTIAAESGRYLASLKMMLQRRVQQAVDQHALAPDAGASWLADLEARAGRGQFYWAALVRWVVGTKA